MSGFRVYQDLVDNYCCGLLLWTIAVDGRLAPGASSEIGTR